MNTVLMLQSLVAEIGEVEAPGLSTFSTCCNN
ncbi:class III lanthipeptide [Amycolatopsis sp. cg5]